MDIGFEGFESSDFDIEIEDVNVKKTGKFDRMWKIGKGGSVENTPIVQDNIVYFGANDGYLYALDFFSGKLIWMFKTGGNIMISSPVISEKMIFIGSFDRNFYSIDKDTGKEIWRFETGGKITSTAALWKDFVYFSSEDGYVYALKQDSGSLVWKFRTGDGISCNPTISDGKVYIGSFDGNIYCIDCEAGREIWRFKTGGEIFSTNDLCVIENMIFFASMDNYLYCVDKNNGKEIWRFRTGKYGNSSSCTQFGNMILHPNRDGHLIALTMEGKELWRFKSKDIMDPPEVLGDRIYLPSGDGHLYCLDSEGKELWRFRTGGLVYNKPTIYKGMVIFGSWDCNLYVVDLETGKEAWRFITSSTVQSSIPQAYEGWKTEIKRETHMEDAVSKEKYKKKKGETVSLSDYHVESEYSSESEYRQKSDYDVGFIMFEDILETEEIIWSSENLKPKILTSN